jgi:hypothetical protein
VEDPAQHAPPAAAPAPRLDHDGPSLPPPPLPPPGACHAFDSRVQLTAQLRQLREQAERRAGGALLTLRLAALVLLVWSLLGIASLGGRLLDEVSGTAWAWLALPLGAAGISVSLYCLVCLPRLYSFHYRRAWQEMLHGEQAALFADDERLRTVQLLLPTLYWGAPAARLVLHGVRDRVEFCAFQLPALQCLLRAPEQPRPALVRGGETSRRLARQFDHAGLVYGCCLLALYFPWLQPLLLAGWLASTPAAIAGCARLCAFVDLYLEEPRIAVAELDPPPADRGRWAALLELWQFRP